MKLSKPKKADEGRPKKEEDLGLLMNVLMGDRFLKRFFKNRLQKHSANPASEAGCPAENKEEKPAEPGDLPGEDMLEKEALSGIKNIGGLTKHSGLQNGSDQLASNTQPLALDKQEE